MKNKVAEKMIEMYGGTIYAVADSQESIKILSEFGDLWNDSEAKVEEENLEACAESLYQSLVATVKKEWISELTADQVSTICGALSTALICGAGKIQICDGVSLDAREITQKWSECHPDETLI